MAPADIELVAQVHEANTLTALLTSGQIGRVTTVAVNPLAYRYCLENRLKSIQKVRMVVYCM